MHRPLIAALALTLAMAGLFPSTSGSTQADSAGSPIASLFTSSEPEVPRPLVAEVTQMSVEAMDGGVILRATALPATQGYWDAALVPTARGAVDGVKTYRFEARPPQQPMPVGSEWSRTVTAAAYLSSYDLDEIREIVVQAERNQRVSRR